MGVTHVRLGERGGHIYLLCDTRGENLHSTAYIATGVGVCLRCINRWNRIARRSESPEQMILALQALLKLKMQRWSNHKGGHNDLP